MTNPVLVFALGVLVGSVFGAALVLTVILMTFDDARSPAGPRTTSDIGSVI